MGLNFSHSTARWSYGGFHYFRKRLANEIGLNLEEMEGFGGVKNWDEVNDPIKPFLNHSDCDGVLTPEECRVVAQRLKELVQDWEDYYDKRNALLLAEDMQYCAEKGITLEFR